MYGIPLGDDGVLEAFTSMLKTHQNLRSLTVVSPKITDYKRWVTMISESLQKIASPHLAKLVWHDNSQRFDKSGVDVINQLLKTRVKHVVVYYPESFSKSEATISDIWEKQKDSLRIQYSSQGK